MWGQVIAKFGFRIIAYDKPSLVARDQGKKAFFVPVRRGSIQEFMVCWGKLADGSRGRRAIGMDALLRHAQASLRHHVGPRCRHCVNWKASHGFV